MPENHAPHADRPPAQGALGELLAALTAPATPEELRAEAEVRAAFVAARGSGRSPGAHPRRRFRSGRPVVLSLLAGKLAAGAAAVTLGATAAAAYAGALPAPLQELAHRTVRAPAAGAVTVVPATPSPTGTAQPTPSASPSPTPSPTGAGQGPDATGPAVFGLCTAYRSGGLAPSSTAYRSLAAAAGGPGGIDAYCATVPAPGRAPGARPTPAPAVTPEPKGRSAASPPAPGAGEPTSHPGAATGKPAGAPGRSGSAGKPGGPPAAR